METSLSKKNRIIILPADSRPASTRLPALVAAAAGLDCALPPPDMPGALDTPADCGAVFKWLDNMLEMDDRISAVALSCDLVAYGGLVQSRLPDSATEITALKNFNFFRELRKRKPGLKMYAFGTILRDAVTASDEASFAEWKEQMGGGPGGSGPGGVRRRNLAVNRLAIRLAGDGVFDFLTIGKEDTAAGNPNGDEIELLKNDAVGFGARKTIILSGADELACLCVARAAADLRGITPSFFIDVPQHTLDRVPLYEPMPLEENLRLEIEAAGGRTANFPDSADFTLMAVMDSQQPDLFLQQLDNAADTGQKLDEEFINNLDRHLEKSRRVGLIDARYVNGSAPALVEHLLDRAVYFRLTACAGWNTTANSSGTVVSKCVASAAAGNGEPAEPVLRAHIDFMLERLVEDYIYSVLVRPKIIGLTGGSLRITDIDSAEKLLFRESAAALESICDKYLLNRRLPVEPAGGALAMVDSCTVSEALFPWKRIFESVIETETSYRLLQ